MGSLPRGTTTGSAHVMAQVAACRYGVGVGVVDELRLLDLRGGRSEVGDLAAVLTGGVPASEGCVRMPGGWWLARSAHRALLLADPGEAERFDGIVRRAVLGRRDIAVDDLSEAHAGITLLGRHAARLASSAAARLADPVLCVAEGEDHRLLIAPKARADDAVSALLGVGRPFGAVRVDARAAQLYRAARPHTNASLLVVNPLNTGVPNA